LERGSGVLFFSVCDLVVFMAIIGFIKSSAVYVEVSGGLLGVLPGFSPVKLVLLVGWVYLCLYFVQRVEFSELVPKKYKPVVNVLTLLTGPAVLFTLTVVDAVKRSSEGEQSAFGIIAGRIRGALGNIRPSSFGRSRDDSKIRLLDSSGRGIKEVLGHGKGGKEDRHVLNLTEEIVSDALEERASDILIDPKSESVHAVRFRIDGVLRNVRDIEGDMGQAVINSIKAVSNMDISERRRPQDGAFTAKMSETTAAFRVASAGVVYGEKLSIRILNQNAGAFKLANVGLSKKQRKTIQSAVNKPSGMILMCSPTGSGKTTSLYAMLNEIDFYTRNVVTVEDPIECVLPNCSQIEVNPRAGITFAKSLRSILRQDPDVICVGEVRDEETAAIALRASQTGHLVFATIHSNTNASALVRLMDLGVSPLLMASGLSTIVSQRLLRRLCSRCKIRAEFSQSQMQEFRRKGINYTTIYETRGCDECDGTGYLGRTGIFDILMLDNVMKGRIANQQLSVDMLKADGDKKGKSNLYKQGLKKVVSGIVSLEELKRVLG